MPFSRHLLSEGHRNLGYREELGYYKASSPELGEHFLFLGALAVTIVCTLLIVASDGGFCPPGSLGVGADYPCGILQNWATVLVWGCLIGGMVYIGYSVVGLFNWLFNWRAELREQERSSSSPRTILTRGNGLGFYHHFDQKGRYVGYFRFDLNFLRDDVLELIIADIETDAWHYTAREVWQGRKKECPSCGSSYPVAQMPRDECWYWVQPHDDCRLFPAITMPVVMGLRYPETVQSSEYGYLDYRSSKMF